MYIEVSIFEIVNSLIRILITFDIKYLEFNISLSHKVTRCSVLFRIPECYNLAVDKSSQKVVSGRSY